MWHVLKTNHLDPRDISRSSFYLVPRLPYYYLAGKFEECYSEIRVKELNWTLWFLHT